MPENLLIEFQSESLHNTVAFSLTTTIAAGHILHDGRDYSFDSKFELYTNFQSRVQRYFGFQLGNHCYRLTTDFQACATLKRGYGQVVN